jgi:hypothetical protein
MNYACENCSLHWAAEEAVICPRCSSRKVAPAVEKKKFGDAKTELTGNKERVAFSHQSFAARDGKEGWKDFHKSEVRACLECGGVEFDLNWKHKEKVCKKCGSVLPLQRRGR